MVAHVAWSDKFIYIGPLSFCHGIGALRVTAFCGGWPTWGRLESCQLYDKKKRGLRIPTSYDAMTCRAVCEVGQEAERRTGAALICSCGANSEPVRILIASQEDLQELGERDLDEVK